MNILHKVRLNYLNHLYYVYKRYLCFCNVIATLMILFGTVGLDEEEEGQESSESEEEEEEEDDDEGKSSDSESEEEKQETKSSKR